MKILAVSDQVVDQLYSPRVKETFGRVDLVVGCGDLPFAYLEFLVSAFNVPLVYVPGNHDPVVNERNTTAHAEGCENLDGRILKVRGLTIGGMGGSMRYQTGRANQYSQLEMSLKVGAFMPALALNRVRTSKPLDLLIAHSPPLGIQDDNDLPHIGFSSFVTLLKLEKPRYFLHGHTMSFSNLVPPITMFGKTTVINVNPYRLIEVESNVR